MNVSVRFSEARLRAQVAANSRQLQDAMQTQYGSDVDLSFAGGDADESGGQTPDESPPGKRSSGPTPPDAAADQTTDADTTHRRTPHGGREWIG